MAIVGIFNGYFRSGTTLVWEVLKKSNQTTRVFYEPFNPNLFIYLESERNQVNPLHKKLLWDEYRKLTYLEIQNLRSLHSNFYHEIPRDTDKLLKYLNFYNTLEGNIILQTNRLHFHYDIIKRNYDIPIIHIIRDPISVFYSIRNTTYSKKNIVNKILKIINFNPFNIQDLADYIYRYYGLPKNLNGNKYKELLFFYNIKEVFLLTWTISNYLSIKSIEKNSKTELLIYEKINESNIIENINKYENISFDLKNCHIKIVNKYNEKLRKEFYKISEKLGISKEYKYILERSGY